MKNYIPALTSQKKYLLVTAQGHLRKIFQDQAQKITMGLARKPCMHGLEEPCCDPHLMFLAVTAVRKYSVTKTQQKLHDDTRKKTFDLKLYNSLYFTPDKTSHGFEVMPPKHRTT
ncbi:hypothetical protein CIHG_00453 [Coccidioides immitis H538.4]|uniref:Uncharacterized protein n=2 Tax=Coccidioides immitis TaxID=5501 RepID=A0A0J8RCR3_COCIT|nr:hypothetical protein CIRG_07269 [Coccidioides immitis RMSCC 2394]KMU82672.1 hypothetical protein CIHG_00453 [Coccidioides immitis H538.4]